MTKKDFLSHFVSNLNAFEAEILLPTLQEYPQDLYRDLFFKLNGRYKTAENILKAIKEILFENAQKRAQASKIKGFDGGRVKEVEILTHFFYEKSLKEMYIKD